VKRRTKDDDGNPVGKRDANPILDTREYEVEFPDGSIDVYTANTLAEDGFVPFNVGRSRAVRRRIAAAHCPQ
jgi:hypothetical protein